MINIAQRLEKIRTSIPSAKNLVAVSKTKPTADILEAYVAGQRIFGENKVQEMCEKYEALPKDIRWHMIGHTQKNKIKYMASFVDLIHGVDSLSTLKEIEKQGRRFRRKIACLLQVKIASETQKFGFSFPAVLDALEAVANYEFTDIKGLMGMATFTENKAQIAQEFEGLQKFYERYKDRFNFETLSMGMSGDYKIALEKGSNMVRVGSAIFGSRS